MKQRLLFLVTAGSMLAQQDRPLTHDQLKAELQKNTAQFIQATNDLDQVTLKLQAYLFCRQHRHWFQFWKKRCRYE